MNNEVLENSVLLWYNVVTILYKVGDYMIAYYKLMDILNRKCMKKIELQKLIGCSPNTMAALSKNRPVKLETINEICKVLNCQPGDILEYIPDDIKIEKNQ